LTYAALTEHHAFGVAKFAAFESSMFRFFRNRKFRKELEQAVADGVLTDDEVRYLEQRSEQLGIDQKFVDEVRGSPCAATGKAHLRESKGHTPILTR
jgi:hypothetical protein